jgi:DNA-binding LacI/PurR family transcriptional regulator
MIHKNKRVTLIDIAKACDVSTATVSRILSGNKHNQPIAEQTRERVLAVAEKMGHMPSRLPQLLKKGRTGLINFSLPSPDVWNPDWLRHVYDYQPILSFLSGYSMIMLTALEERHRQIDAVFHFRQQGKPFDPLDFKMDMVDGIVYSSPSPHESSTYFDIVRKGFPVVFDTILTDHPDYYCVGGDNEFTARKAVEYLLATGRRKIRLVVPESHDIPLNAQRIRAYKKTVSAAGCMPVECLEFTYKMYRETLDEITRQILIYAGGQVDGLVFGDTITAYNFVTHVQSKGIRIPDDVSVICLGDRIECQICTPMLTALYQPTALVFSEAMDMLTDIIAGKPPSVRHRIIEPAFSVRGSCGGSQEVAEKVLSK